MDKRVVLVVLDKKDYINKAQDLLSQRDMYRPLAAYPTKKHENKIINIFRTIKIQGGLVGTSPMNDYTQMCRPSKILWTIQNSWKVHPLRNIVSGRGAVTYGVAKELSNILSPLEGHTPYLIGNTEIFVEQINIIRLEQGEYITSYNVKALFTSVPVDPTIIKHKMQQVT